MDFLAWDLGDPGGNMQIVVQNGTEFSIHPMKGPMTTQTLRGLEGNNPLHWRGDRADFNAFNGAFDALMGASQLPDADMAAFTAFINTIRFMPNPNQNLDRSMPATFGGGSPLAGLNTFVNESYLPPLTCNNCHKIDPGPGTSNTLQFVTGQLQPFKVPHLRNLYQKIGFNKDFGSISVSGFGLLHDGSQPGLFELLSQQQFHLFASDTVRKLNLSAFLLCFDTGMAPAVGYSRTLTPQNVRSETAQSDVGLLLGQAAAGNIDLIAKGSIDGLVRGLFYIPLLAQFVSDTGGVGPFSIAEIGAKVAQGDVITLMGVPRGSGARMGIDRDLDGVGDGMDAVYTTPVAAH